ncbi:PucR family transcriptional regulator [Pseudonocardia sp. GCM10023141]|uniref:PucR family transcriptional regulator n=1 Tax=Pseudonocardia sp. GCM10023141 TaxID=3252653 RepID=UPI00361BF9DE
MSGPSALESIAMPTAAPVPENPANRLRPGLAAAELAQQLQSRLTGAVLGGAEADDVVDVLSELLGRPVALLDPLLRVRRWAAPSVLRLNAPPSLAAAVLANAAVRAALDALGPTRPSVELAPHLPSGLTRRHLVAVLIAEGEVAGYLDVMEVGRPLGSIETLLAEYAAAIVSLQLLGEARQIRASTQARDDVLADLLGGSRSAADLRRLAVHVGLDLQGSHVVIRLPVDPSRSPAACRAGVVATVGAALGEQPCAVVCPEAVVLVVRLPDEPGPPAIRRVQAALREVLDAVHARTGVRRAVVSGVCCDVPDFPAAHAETREVDAIVAALGGRADVVSVTELSALRLVVNSDRAEIALRFAEDRLGPLRRNDAATGGNLVETLRCYLAMGAQVRATARALAVHENTVRYRLGRIEHVTGLDMRRFDMLLTAQLAFQVEELGAPAQP